MLQLFKTAVKSALATAGIGVVRLRPKGHQFGPPPGLETRWLEDLGIRTVLDVGAHIGESAVAFRQMFPQSQIYSFEPDAQSYRQLESKVGGRPNHQIFNVGLGEASGSAVLHRSEFSPSSSLLKMASRHKEDFPFTAGATEVSVQLTSLDEVAAGLSLDAEVLMKIDTQGFEEKVLAGAERTLPKVRIAIVETSFVPLYEGQPLFPKIYDHFVRRGFEYVGSWGQLLSPRDGRPLQQDAIFVNPR